MADEHPQNSSQKRKSDIPIELDSNLCDKKIKSGECSEIQKDQKNMEVDEKAEEMAENQECAEGPSREQENIQIHQFEMKLEELCRELESLYKIVNLKVYQNSIRIPPRPTDNQDEPINYFIL